LLFIKFSKKAVFLISLVFLLSIVSDASAIQVWFYGGAESNGIWNDANNWYGGKPTSADHANLNTGGSHCIVDSNHTGGSAAVCDRLTLPDWENAGDTQDYCFLDITGGTIAVGGNFGMGRWGGGSAPYDRGMITISDGTVTAGGYMSVGESGEGIINMTGGTIDIDGTLYIPKESAGDGTVNLDGGTISAGGISMNANGLVDINDGELIIDGNVVGTINNYVNNGWITATDVAEEVLVDYNSVTNLTTVTASEATGILVDNFESYNDTAGLKVTWHDDSNGGVNSTISLETEITHLGKSAKSMKYQYDNNSAPYYSQVYRTYDTAQDWTLEDSKVLTLFFHGVEDNDAEQMYVVLEDDEDVNAAVLYDGDANDLIQQEAEYWNLWNIILQDFNDNGIDLTGIKKIIIGFGDRDNPQPGSLGTVYLDDIGLYPSRCAADYDYLPRSDFNRDTMVNLFDCAGLAYAWLTDLTEPDFREIYDLDSNDVINIADFAIFAQDWLWPEDQVQITVDACDIKGDISTMLTGVNMNFADDTDAMWADGSVAGYLSDVKAGILRYPGGAKTGHYHWEYPEVPKYMDAWDPAVDPNNYTSTTHMDTDEYIAWCGVIGAEPLLGINIQSGHKYNRIAESIAEAGRWVQYCKDKNYNVTYWYLDNELYYGHNADPITVEEYTNYIKQFVPEMRAVDPNIKIIVGWENKLGVESYWDDWEYLIEQANEYIDIADLHWYWAWGYCTWELWLSDNPMIVREWCGDCPGSRYYGPTYAEEIRQFYEKIKDVNGVSYDIKLAALEWNIGPNGGFDFSRFQHALMHAEMLGQYIEGGLHMATMWPLTWIGGIGNDFRAIIDQENHKSTPSFYVFKLYSNALGQQLATSQTNQVYIRPVSALSQDGNTLWVYLLNKSSDGQAVRATVDISGFTAAKGEAISLTAPDLSSDVGKLKKLKVHVNSQTGKWQSVLPPYSLTMLTFHKDN